MLHLLRHGHFKQTELLGTYSYEYYEVRSSYCIRCHPELEGTETLQDFFDERNRQRYGNYLDKINDKESK